MPGAAGQTSELAPGHFSVSTGWRYVYSNQYYLGPHINHQLNNVTKPVRWWNTLDATVSYQATKRVNVSVTLPFAINLEKFNAPGNGNPLEFRQVIPARAFSDTLIMARTWIRDPEVHRKQNFLVGLGVKLPTGNFHETAVYGNYAGLDRMRKPIPIAIMPGDGGVDILGEILGYRSVNFPVRKSQVFAYANYLVTPRDTTGVSSIIATEQNTAFVNPANVRAGALVNTVPDSYAIRSGYIFPIPHTEKNSWLKGLQCLIGYRFEGSPRHDLIGGSQGYRKPGYFMAIEPGIFYRNKYGLLTVSGPISFLKNAYADIAQQHGSGDPRTTTFTQAALNLRYTYYF